MGLAAAKNKRKLGTDPNNTKWSRNETTFGQKILRAQGWQPGEFLGAKDAAHAVHHTEASSSHIKVTLKDDNLGLGAKRNNGDECTGLFDFQHLLGRLNGKSEDVLEAEKQKRENHMRNHYLEQKIGTIRFVRGGWLVGDVVKEKVTEEDGVPQSDTVDQQVETVPSQDTKDAEPTKRKSKKRKADSDEEDEKEEKKDKKVKKRKTDTEAETDSESSRSKKKERKDKKEKKDQKEKKDKKDKKKLKDAKQSEENSSDDVESSATETKKPKKDKKREKKEKKDKKKDKKEKKRKEKELSDSATESEDSKSKAQKRMKDGAETETSTPGGSGTSTPTVTSSTRFLARQRFIAQKKMAFTDSAALNQIFMIKS
ncbi:hypothetical protein NEUTE1DRAFT_73486 [Neurospora tetrasperma FGSC 2508]|uniref:PinX1-related protein 1 n=1 Tax=Neurospora tetrasperma (strain FGSC 2508 / ATCC MYA-4615 / P0657) TaxID=510951 RepID=F8N1G2_NEUT8|nr:uncharacterized protein NEUTE1DRAFT_73486 [Neurospora tetrasperma FGSC 2508]EGO53142.1 hypothetical protein NEUTE1DRAFT_73486 [Neurospora tetrasperma FGSC 2508]